MTMQTLRDWRLQLTVLWRRWNRIIETGRRNGDTSLAALVFPGVGDDGSLGESQSKECLVPEAPLWACPDRGLGDWARFALVNYLQLPPRAVRLEPQTARRVPADCWCAYVNGGGTSGVKLLTPAAQQEFERQSRREALAPLFQDTRLWEALAAASSRYAQDHHQRNRLSISGTELRNRRFSGATAVVDFISFVHTGIVPPRQAPFPDELADLGVCLPGGFVRRPFFPGSRERRQRLGALVQHLARLHDPGPLGSVAMQISCLWSPQQPHGLVAACERVILRYDRLCSRNGMRRLPVIFIPVGGDTSNGHVTRTSVVRDLHAKLVVRRAQIRDAGTLLTRLQEHPSTEEIAHALTQIREELATHPTLLVFGIHHVLTGEGVSLEEEMLSTPFPYILERLMPQTGDLDHLHPPERAHATQVLLLADARIDCCAGLPVTSFELPGCPPEQLGLLMQWLGCSRLAALREKHGAIPDVGGGVFGETELCVAESALALDERATQPEAVADLRTQVLRILRTEPAQPDGARLGQLLEAILRYLHEEERQTEHAWLSTALHVVALVPGGVRLFTMARVLAAYAIAVAADGAHPGPDWCRGELWRPEAGPVPGELAEAAERRERRALEVTVVRHVMQLKSRACGLLRTSPSGYIPGFDEYDHPYESPEMPPLQLDIASDCERVEFVSATARVLACEQLRSSHPARHSLLNRLLSEEFVRRVMIVSAHHAEAGLRLVDKHYALFAIHHGLESLAYGAEKLLSHHGHRKARWLIPALSRLGAYRWIYRWLYVELLNAGEESLSRRHGAERLRGALLNAFVRADPQPYRLRNPAMASGHSDRNVLRHFEMMTAMLEGLVDVGIRTSDAALAHGALRQLRDLRCHIAATAPATAGDTSPASSGNLRLVAAQANCRIALLALDVAVRQSTEVPSSAHTAEGHRRIFRAALQALQTPGITPPCDLRRVKAAIAQGMRNRRCPLPQQWRFLPAVKMLREAVPEAQMQHFYDALVRYAELIAGSAGSREPKRGRRRMLALTVFELADALRTHYSFSTGAAALHLAARPAYSVARVCLGLGQQQVGSWYLERAGYYCGHVIGIHAQQRVERIDVLIIRAMALRLPGPAADLTLAMRLLKTAERALMEFPDHLQLWVRFYLERARLFCERALQPGLTQKEAAWCAAYCRADVDAIGRLAGQRPGWKERARRILDRLPPSLKGISA
jgi:hypothetical protein